MSDLERLEQREAQSDRSDQCRSRGVSSHKECECNALYKNRGDSTIHHFQTTIIVLVGPPRSLLPARSVAAT